VSDRTGQDRWPAVPLEIAFNLLALVAFLALRKTKRLPGQHFHLYLIGYGGFRFFHEFLREEPRLVIGLTGYQIASLAVLALGVIGFLSRKRAVEALLAGSTVE
jgi:phosphatidylglycerol:prolipoprotein diacylglycerol transferase